VSTQLIERLYAAMNAHDGEAMAACYTADARFSDPVFLELTGDEPGDMWRMLTSRSADLSVELAECEADERSGSARWIATYTFTQTNRKVVNDVRARFRFRDGLIAEHLDDFSLYGWTRQALGPVGTLFGWTPMIQAAVRRRARAGLAEFQRR
jgi:ketosteroid isomerase-like protein